MSGYTDCACRDCFDIAIDGNLCGLCKAAGCVRADDPDYQHPNLSHALGCQREDAYGMDEETDEETRPGHIPGHTDR